MNCGRCMVHLLLTGAGAMTIEKKAKVEVLVEFGEMAVMMASSVAFVCV